MATLRIPEQYRSGLAKLRSLSDESFEKLLVALQKSPPMVKAEELSDRVAPEVPGIAKNDLGKIIRTLSSLYFVRVDAEVSTKRLASDVCAAMQSTGDEELKLSEPEQPKFKDRLEKLLSVDSLSHASKAVGLRGDFARLFCDAKILTDLRPIFAKPEEPPVGAVITNTLKLGYHEGRNHREFYLTLDAEDISNLRKVLIRAESKAKSLKALLEKIGMPDLETKS